MSTIWLLAKGNLEAIERGELTRDMQRQGLAEKALEVGADYMMWLDDDTISPNFAVQWLHRELANRPDAGVCGGIYCTKEAVPQPLVFDEIGGGPTYNWTVGEAFECKGLATGCMMVKSSILKDIPKPWFRDHNEAPVGQTTEYNGIQVPLAKSGGTDDLYFCQKVTDAGYKIIAHGGVLPVHVGQDGKRYTLPLDTYPCTSFDKKQAERRRENEREITGKNSETSN